MPIISPIIYPPFAATISIFEQKLKEAGLPFDCFCGYRSFEEQAVEFAKGRTVPGQIVTKAAPGLSYHQYAVARDYVEHGQIDKPSLEWSWNMQNDLNHDGRKDYIQMAELAQACGLEPALFWKTFPEGPHIQLAGLPDVHKLLKIFHDAGDSIFAVWAELDKIYK
jgi:peptidoglycan LD-endopeptidase CwlK